MKKPNTCYTRSGKINIAYQVFGSGKMDLVYIPGWVSNIDLMWDCHELVDFLTELSKHVRVILFDKRGTGLSDRLSELSTLEERMDDIRAVMDAVDSKKAVLFGHSEGGSVSALFAATYPSRTIALITFGAFAKRKYSPWYPWAPTDEERQEVYDMIEQSWGRDDMDVASLAPSKANDKVFMSWLARYFRSGASPSAAMVLTRMNTEVDIIGILDSVTVPTLVLQRTHDIDVKIEEGRFIADKISDAKFIEFDGVDHLFWVGNTEEVLVEMVQFLKGLQPRTSHNTQLLAVVVAEISSNHNQDATMPLVTLNFDEVNRMLIEKHKGQLHKVENNTFLATFEGSVKAINCCIELQGIIQSVNMELKAGVHLGQCSIVKSRLQDTDTIVNAEKLKNIAQEGQILVSQTVKNLSSDASLNFLQDLSLPEECQELVYIVEDVFKDFSLESPRTEVDINEPSSFLEKVIDCIEEHLADETFNVDKVCKSIGYSERQLQRKLKVLTNKSPNQLIRSVRLHKAKELLQSSTYNIADLAYTTGFSNPSYFSKCFRDEFGMSPSEIN